MSRGGKGSALFGRISRPSFAVLLGLLVTYYFFYPHAEFAGTVPDNIAQTAYFKLLTRQHLVGGIGSSSPKAGLIFLLGIFHYLSYELLNSAWLFKLLVSSFFSATLFLIYRTAATLGGEVAGGAALLISAGTGYLTLTFFTVSSNLFFLPLVLAALFMLCKDRERAAVLLLSIGATIRPEALIIVFFILAIRTLPAGRLQRSLEYAAYGAAAFFVYVLVAYWVQGSWTRIAGGSATGYPAFASLRTMEHVRATIGQFFSDRFVGLLWLPACYSLVRLPASRALAYFFSMTIVFAGLSAIGALGFHFRYIASAQAVVFALGCAGIARFAGDSSVSSSPGLRRPTLPLSMAASGFVLAAYWSSPRPATLATVLAIPALFVLVSLVEHSRRCGQWVQRCRSLVFALLVGLAIISAYHVRQELRQRVNYLHPSIQDAQEFLSHPVAVPGSSVLAEDEMLNYLIVKRPDYFRKVHSLQSFNVLSERGRRRVLKGTDFLYVSKRRNYGWNYLFYFPRADWRKDAFRQAVHRMINDNQSRRILGVTLSPVYNSPTRFIARVEPHGDTASLRRP